MKKHKSKKFLYASLAAVAIVFLGWRTSDTIMSLGTTGADSQVNFSGSTGIIKYNDTDSKLQFSNDSGSNFTDIGSGSGGGTGINFGSDINPDFEASDPPSNWTKSGSSTFVAETSAQLFGDQSGKFNSSAASENLDWDAVAIEIGLRSQQCAAQIYYKYDTGTGGDYKLQALDGSSNVLAEIDLEVTTTAGAQKAFVVFTCPSTGNVQLRITSTANGGDLILDNAHIGSNPNEVQVGSSELVFQGQYAPTANCQWGRTNTALGAFTSDSDCPAITTNFSSGSVTVDSADNDLPDLVFSSLPPGRYQVNAQFTEVAGATGADRNHAITDGTTVSGRQYIKQASSTANITTVSLTGVYEYSTSAARTFSIHGAASSSSTNLSNTGVTDSTERTLIWTVTRYPLDSESAINFDQADWHIDADLGGASPSLGLVDKSNWGNINDAGLDMVLNTGSASAFVACNGTEIASGATCTADESVGVAFPPPYNGTVQVCFGVVHNVQTNATNEFAEAYFQVIKRDNADDTTGFVEGNQVKSHRFEGQQGSVAVRGMESIDVCGVFELSDSGLHTFDLMYTQEANLTPVESNILADRTAGATLGDGDRSISVTARMLTQFRGGIRFDNMVESANVAGEKAAVVTIDYQGTGVPVVLQDTGSLVSSLTDNGTGDVTVNWVGSAWTNAPECQCTVRDNSSHFCAVIDAPPLTTSSRFRIWNTAGANVDPSTSGEGLTLRCVGQK